MANGSKMEFLSFYSLDSAIWMSKNVSVHQVCRTKPLNNFCQAQFQSSPSPVQLKLSTALIPIISTPTRDSSNQALLDNLER